MSISAGVITTLGTAKTAIDAVLSTCNTEAAAKDLDGSLGKPNDWSQARDHMIRYLKSNAADQGEIPS